MASSEPFISSVDIWPLDWAPDGWLVCNGQLLQIAQYQALFALVGTRFGGNGTTNFALPDLRGRVPVGMGQGTGLSPYQLGQMGGAENVTLNTNNLPSHTHTATVTEKVAIDRGVTTSTTPVNNYHGLAPDTAKVYATPASATEHMAADSVTVNLTPTGAGQGFSNLQPYLALNYIIAYNGIFPSRP